ncbi:unnamed protein product [Ectocarpus sp. 12 AP-2014]
MPCSFGLSRGLHPEHLCSVTERTKVSRAKGREGRGTEPTNRGKPDVVGGGVLRCSSSGQEAGEEWRERAHEARPVERVIFVNPRPAAVALKFRRRCHAYMSTITATAGVPNACTRNRWRPTCIDGRLSCKGEERQRLIRVRPAAAAAAAAAAVVTA